MAKTKHTPGPWHVTTWPGDADVPEGCSIGIDDRLGAEGGRDYYLATVVHGDPDELQANARLVAASPQLLAAAKVAYKLLDSVAFVSQEGDSHKALRLLREAITLATEEAA